MPEKADEENQVVEDVDTVKEQRRCE